MARLDTGGTGFRTGAVAPAATAAASSRRDPHDPVELEFSRLMLAIAGRAEHLDVDGVFDHCWMTDAVLGAEGVRAALRWKVADALERRTAIRVGVVGGGTTGVQVAAEIARTLGSGARLGHPACLRRSRVLLIEAAPRLLPACPEALAQAADRTLGALEVVVRTGAKVVSVQAQGFRLQTGERLAADLLVWAAGA